MKKALSLFLAIVLIVAIGIPVLAATSTTATFSRSDIYEGEYDYTFTISNVTSQAHEARGPVVEAAADTWIERPETLDVFYGEAPMKIELTKGIIPNVIMFWDDSIVSDAAVEAQVMETPDGALAVGTNVIFNEPGVYEIIVRPSMIYDTEERFMLVVGQEATTTPPPADAKPTKSVVSVNGGAVDVDMYLINGENNYIKVRDLAYMLNGTNKQFEVGYDAALKTVSLTSGKPYAPVGGEMAVGDGQARKVNKSSYTLYVDGKKLDLTVYVINGNNYYKLRDLCKAFDVSVGYDVATKAIGLDTSKPYVD